jgi:hypothetical protein
MKKMKQKFYTLAIALFLTGYSFGQTIDQKRMDRDLKIAENILQTLSNHEGYRLYSSNNRESSYIPDYGVIFSLPGNRFNVRNYKGNNRGYIMSGATSGNVVVAPSSDGGTYSYSYSTIRDHDDDCEDCPDKKETKETKDKIKEKVIKEHEDWVKKSEETFKEQSTAFLVDYADLIGQLKPTDKIMISSKSKSNDVRWVGEGVDVWVGGDNSRNNQSTGRTAEIAKSDLIAYKKGNISREATIKKIKFSTSVKDEKVERDLELFGSIFAKLFDSDLSSTYYTSSSRINYERMDNFGAIYNMRVYSSSSDNGRHTIRTTRESGLTQEERDSKVNAMYPEFERSVKENLLDYGRTIKSLKPTEMLMFKIRLTTCEDCEMPRSIEVSVRANILTDYGLGKTSKENAMKAITVKKTPNN